MSFAFFRGEDIFPRGQLRVPPYLRNYAKTTARRCEDEYISTEYQQLNSGLDGTIQGRSLGKSDSHLSAGKPGSFKPFIEPGNAKTKNLGTPEKFEKTTGIERTEMNRSQLNDLHRSIQTRLTGPALESFDLYPLASMRCTGQRMSLAESQQNPPKRGSIPSCGDEATRESLASEHVVSNGATTSNSHAVSLNKLYSCLKKIKSRRNEVGQYDDLASMSMNGREPGFSRSYFQRVFTSNNANSANARAAESEEIFLLLGGKSKPVRFEINPEGLNLLEKEWRIELKSRDSIFCNSDEEGLQLLEKFRARFRSNQRANFLDRKTPILPIPWARHIVHKGRVSPEEKEQLEEDESGRKLSIHVYLPNAGWDEQRHSTPSTPMFSPPT